MKHPKVAVAQVCSEKGDVSANIDVHVSAIEKASAFGVSYLVFPELSLTGYEPELAQSLAFTANDRRLTPLILAAQQYRLYAVVGAPLKTAGLPHIGAFVVTPSGDVRSYSKMHLHPGESRFFSVGSDYLLIDIAKERIANAICADTNTPGHALACAERGATVYMAGALISEGGYPADTEKLKGYACEYDLLVAMANHCGSTGRWHPVGRSAIWGPSGQIAVAGESQPALVIAQRTTAGWVGEVVEL